MAQIPNPYSEFLREPNLLIPGRKPVGPVKIDPNYTQPLYLNIPGVNPGRVSDNSGWDSDIVVNVGEYGIRVLTPNNNTWGAGLNINSGDAIASTSGSYTFEYLVRFTSESAATDYFLDVLTGRLIIGARNQFFTINDGGWRTSSISKENNKLTHIFYVLDGANSIWNLYVNKDWVYSEEESVAEYTSKNIGGTTRLFSRYFYSGAGQSLQNASLYMCAIYESMMPKAEIKSRLADPYQFLIPA